MTTLDALQKLSSVSSSSPSTNKTTSPSQSSFGDILKQTLNDVNETQKEAQNATIDLATGQIKDIHQAAMAINKAELSMKMVLEVRNKAVSAYKEILRTQI